LKSKYVGGELEIFSLAQNWKNYWRTKISPFLGDRVLDVGAGIGSNLTLLWKKPSYWLCIEPDADFLVEILTKARLLGAAEYVEVANCCISELVAKDRLFDTIIYIDVLEHIEHDSIELEMASRLLMPNGHLIVLSPAYQWLYSPFDTAVGHFRRYTRNQLISCSTRSLTLIKSEYLDSIGILPGLLNKLILKKHIPTPREVMFWDKIVVPISIVVDKLTFNTFGRTVYAIWTKK